MSSYPRSGSSVLQQLINYVFKEPWSSVDFPLRPLERISGVPNYFQNWQYDNHPWQKRSVWKKIANRLNKSTLNVYNLEKWLATYDLAIPPFTKNRQYILPGCLDALTPKNRKKLASSHEVFFIKTHFKPYRKYFEGEYVIQISRHPGPVFVSYSKLLNKMGKDKSLEDIILGKVIVGSWNSWQQEWQKTSRSLGSRFLCLRYEDVLRDRLAACEAIKSTIHRDFDPEGISNIPDFEDLKSEVPDYYGVGKSTGWENKYNPEQKDLLYQLHGKVLESMGYQ